MEGTGTPKAIARGQGCPGTSRGQQQQCCTPMVLNGDGDNGDKGAGTSVERVTRALLFSMR